MKTNLLLAATAVLFTAVLPASAGPKEKFDWTNLVSDIPGVTHHTDPHAVNSWGLVPAPDGTIWVANNGTHSVTVYDAQGKPSGPFGPLVVDVPTGSSVMGDTSAPTGIVLNFAAFGPGGANGFVVTKGIQSGPAQYLICSEDGAVTGYNYSVDPTNAILAINHNADGAIYKGLALSFDDAGQNHRLYVANFHSGKIEVYDHTFAADTAVTTAINSSDPNPVAGFAPFNVKHLVFPDPMTHLRHRYIVVAYAMQDAQQHDELHGPGLGYVNIFNTDGTFVKRFVQYSANPASANDLNAPWGMAVAHKTFGEHSHVLLVGSFGDGKIHRYSLDGLSGTPVGALKGRNGDDLQFDGLWAIHFSRHPGNINADPDDNNELDRELYFAAGIADESHGLVGRIMPK